MPHLVEIVFTECDDEYDDDKTIIAYNFSNGTWKFEKEKLGELL